MEGNPSGTGSNQGLKKITSEDEDIAQLGKALGLISSTA